MFSINEYMKMNTTLLLMLDWTCACSGLFSSSLSFSSAVTLYVCSSLYLIILVYKTLLLKYSRCLSLTLLLSILLCDLESCFHFLNFCWFGRFRNIAGIMTDIGFEVLLCDTLPGKALGDCTKLISACCGQIAMQWLISKHFYNS